jgi:serine/threonine-protein kinase
MRVSAAGGTPEVFGALSPGATTQRWPQALPGSQAVLFTEHSSTTDWDAANLVVAPLSGGASKVIVRGGHYGRYLPSGHLIYLQQGTLFAVRFDLTRLETVGQAVPALEGVASSPSNGSAQLAVSSGGTLVYVPGSAATVQTRPIDWLTRDGKTAALRATNAAWTNPRFSPDGQKLVLEIFDGKQRDVWVYEWARDTLTQLTFDPGQDRYPVWTPDGRRIAFASDRAKAGTGNLYWVNADGTGDVTRLTDSPADQRSFSWHPSGKFLAFTATRGAAGSDLMILPMEGDATRGWTPGTPTAFLSTPVFEGEPMFSPDGRWIAYSSSEAGNNDLYVRPFPGPGGKWRISTTGGTYPQWSVTARELLFIGQAQIRAASYAVVGDSFRADTPHAWSPTRVQGQNSTSRGYDLHPDGQRVATSAAPEDSSVQDHVVFFFNFGDYLRTIAPGTK